MDSPRETLTKGERLHSKKDISALLARGRFSDVPGGLRFCFLYGTGSGINRMMVSVPKKNFRRAVKRNLLKRRIRESFRRQKSHLEGLDGTDILFIYGSKEILTYKDIYDAVGRIIDKINDYGRRKAEKVHP
ncbi:MAG: ribonuclease P protein component [Bacteroidales bacterium]|nr:ribonuclease P protein component [Bacteroidales bacterium]